MNLTIKNQITSLELLEQINYFRKEENSKKILDFLPVLIYDIYTGRKRGKQ